MSTRRVLGTDDGAVTTNFKRPVAGDLVPGAADTVLQTNAAGTAAEWEKIFPANLQPGGLNTVLNTNVGGVVSWNGDIALNHLNLTGILRFKGITPPANAIVWSGTGASDNQWDNFPRTYGSQTNIPYRAGGVDSTTMADIHFARVDTLVNLRFASATITVPAAGSLLVSLGVGIGTAFDYAAPIIADVNGVRQTIMFQMDTGGARYFKDISASPFVLGDVVFIPYHSTTHQLPS